MVASEQKSDRLTPEVLPWFLRDPQAAIAAYKRRRRYVVLDFETTNISNGLAIFPENRIVLAVWYVVQDGKVTKKHQFGDEYEQRELVADIQGADFIVAHNVKFELQWLDRCGVDLRSLLCYDTMLAEWVIAGNRKVPLNLDDTARRYGLGGKESLVSMMIKQGICPSEIPETWLLEYCDDDVDLCHRVMLKQFPIFDKQQMWHLVLQRNLVAPVLADIEPKGLQLDKEKVYAEHERLTEVVHVIGERLDAITRGINLGSPKQLGQFLYGTLGFAPPRDNAGKVIETGSGALSTAVTALAKLEPTTEAQVEFLELYKEYNLASSMLSKNVDFFKRVCDEKGGVFYGQLRQGQTANHRLASSGVKLKFKDVKKEFAPQLQNLPRRYKPLFTAHKDGYVVTEYDGSQIEFRVAADEGDDDQAVSDIVNGVDIHSFTRDTMNNAYLRLAIKKVLDRQDAKPQTFAPLAIAALA